MACAPGLWLFRAAVDFALEPASHSAYWQATTQFLLGYPQLHPTGETGCTLEALLRLCPHLLYL